MPESPAADRFRLFEGASAELPAAPREAWYRRAGAKIWSVVLKYMGTPR